MSLHKPDCYKCSTNQVKSANNVQAIKFVPQMNEFIHPFYRVNNHADCFFIAYMVY